MRLDESDQDQVDNTDDDLTEFEIGNDQTVVETNVRSVGATVVVTGEFEPCYAYMLVHGI